jgi:hypothetical protein
VLATAETRADFSQGLVVAFDMGGLLVTMVVAVIANNHHSPPHEKRSMPPHLHRAQIVATSSTTVKIIASPLTHY